MGLIIKVLKAGNGDSILISLNENNLKKNILIDGGNNLRDFKNNLKLEILELQNKKESIDLLIITHIDQDHIKGIEFLLKDPQIDKNCIKNVWFNSFSTSSIRNNDISYREATNVVTLINYLNIPINTQITVEENPQLYLWDIKINIFSPYKADVQKIVKKNNDISSASNDYKYSIHELIEKNTLIFIDKKEDLNTSAENKSSIAFLLEYNEKKVLFLGDAEPAVIHKSLAKLLKEREIDFLEIDFLKLSHHGSHKSLSFDLFKYIKCNNFIISANGKKENLPNKLTFVKILKRSNKGDSLDYFYFNYSNVSHSMNFTNEEKIEFKFDCVVENYDKGYIIEI